MTATGATTRSPIRRLEAAGPTVLAGVPDDARVVAEEQFGAVIPVLSYQDLDDAISRANDTHYDHGLENGQVGLLDFTDPQMYFEAKRVGR